MRIGKYKISTWVLVTSALLWSCFAIGVWLYEVISMSMDVREGFAEFYVLGPAGKVEGYPTNLTLGENGTVILGVVNHEYEEVNYSIVTKLDDETVGTIEGIRLMHEEKWEQNYTFTPEKTGDKMKLKFLLFRECVDDPYSSLHLWISVKS